MELAALIGRLNPDCRRAWSAPRNAACNAPIIT